MGITQILSIAIIILACIGAIIYLAWQIKKKGLRKVAIDLIVEAEERLDDNQERFNSVVNTLIMLLPKPFNFIITTKTIEKLVQTTFDEIKKALDYIPEENLMINPDVESEG